MFPQLMVGLVLSVLALALRLIFGFEDLRVIDAAAAAAIIVIMLF